MVITSPSQLCGQNPCFGADIDRIPCVSREYVHRRRISPITDSRDGGSSGRSGDERALVSHACVFHFTQIDLCRFLTLIRGRAEPSRAVTYEASPGHARFRGERRRETCRIGALSVINIYTIMRSRSIVGDFGLSMRGRRHP